MVRSRSRKQKQALERARHCEQQSDPDGAVQAYLAASAPLEAAAVLARCARHEEAGQLLLSTLGVAPEEVMTLPAEGRKRARMAASYLSRAAEPTLAITLFVALGERGRAAELLERMGDLLSAQRVREGASYQQPQRPRAAPTSAAGAESATDARALERIQKLEREGKLEVAAQVYVQMQRHADAGRVFAAMGQLLAAGESFERAKMPYEAAVCFLRAGDDERGITQLIRVSRKDPRYRKAAKHAIAIAQQRGSLSFQLEHFVAELIATGPVDREERDCFVALAALYRKEGMFTSAIDTLQRVVKRFEEDDEARAKLRELEGAGHTGSDVFRKISAQDSSFSGDSGPRREEPAVDEMLPGLPALPRAPHVPTLSPAYRGKIPPDAKPSSATAAAPGTSDPHRLSGGAPRSFEHTGR
jgi:tetratricopeptide (TPR) repeat protein